MQTRFHRRATLAALLSVTALAAACGGGGSGGSDGPQIAPAPPPPTGPAAPETDHVSFSNVAMAAGLTYQHGFTAFSPSTEAVAGVAVGDYDADGWLDLFIAQGDTGTNLLYRNLTGSAGNYSFTDVAAAAGVAGAVQDKASGPAFADYDGDGDMDLFVGSVEYSEFRVFRNDGGNFVDVTAAAGLAGIVRENNVSLAFGDYDQDDDLDLFIAHWTFTQNELPPGSPQFLWRNNGDGTFTDVSDETFMSDAVLRGNYDYSFTPTFADIDSDGDSDMLLVADNYSSEVILNNGHQGGGLYTFTRVTNDNVITDQAGMGSAVADFDNDGDLDWFVSSIEEQAQGGLNGNRYYENTGNGLFADRTTAAGVRSGFWGWASCAADFNNDGHLDIFHVNGISSNGGTDDFTTDLSRLFMADGDGTFTEMSAELGIVDRDQGRGVVCFDGDQDGDIDIFVANNEDTPSLFRNDGGNTFNWMNVLLAAAAPNTGAVGARVYVSVDGVTQMREVTIGNNYVSHNPLEQHFGLARAAQAASIRVVWPDGTQSERSNVTANQRITVTYPDSWDMR